MAPPLAPSRQFKVYIKQQRVIVDENESWFQVWERIATQHGMPRWSVFKLELVDGSVTKPANSSSDADDTWTFEWIPGKQYWRQNVSDPGVDQRLAPGMQIKLRSKLGEETMAIFRRWNAIDI
jgi:hypothetical protein